MSRLLCLFAACFLWGACQKTPPPAAPAPAKATLKLTSPAFAAGANIPKQYTCDGDNVSPPLLLNTVPEGTSSLALIAEDPDAPNGTWVHWVFYNLPPDLKEWNEAIPPEATLANSSYQGLNDFKKTGYGGPCPPPGEPHRYFFRVYALDVKLRLPPGATQAQLAEAMRGHILGEGELIGTYSRK